MVCVNTLGVSVLALGVGPGKDEHVDNLGVTTGDSIVKGVAVLVISVGLIDVEVLVGGAGANLKSPQQTNEGVCEEAAQRAAIARCTAQ